MKDYKAENTDVIRDPYKTVIMGDIMKEKLLVAMSGGVDSSVAAYMSVKAGNICTGATFIIDENMENEKEGDSGAVKDAETAARRLGMEHTVIDCSELFIKQVIDYFVSSYERGETPNPCVACNKNIKFGYLLDKALEDGFDAIVTGHYAILKKDGERTYLYRAKDPSKDQSYMLAYLDKNQLSHARFPLGEYSKKEIRQIAAEAGLEVAAKKDSQDICFIKDGDYVKFIEQYTGRKTERGEYVDTCGNVIGHHNGQLCYTIGQRKGLGMSFGRHMYVLDKDADTNRVVLGDHDDLFSSELTAHSLNLIACDRLCDGEKLLVKIRYAHKPAEAAVYTEENNTVRVIFDVPQRAVSRGQLAVFYSGDCVVGSAVIS